jgi:hypothetical protein
MPSHPTLDNHPSQQCLALTLRQGTVWTPDLESAWTPPSTLRRPNLAYPPSLPQQCLALTPRQRDRADP